MSKKLLLLLLSMLLIAALSAACSSSNNQGGAAGQPSSSPAPGASEPPAGAQEETPAEPVKLRLAYSDLGQSYVNASTNISKDQYVLELGRLTNTELDIELLSHQAFGQSLTLLFAGGDLPDLIQTDGIDKAEVAPAIGAGALTPLNELIDQYGPNMKKNIPQEAWESGQVSKDGVIYAIPELSALPNRLIVYVRKDWADALGIDLPTLDNRFTVEQYLDMLRQFKQAAPADNPIPLTGRERLNYTFNFFGAYDAIPTQWRLVNGELTPNFVRPEMKQALELYRTMYTEGLLDGDVFTMNGNDWNSRIDTGRVGMWVHDGNRADMWHTRIVENSGDPGAEVVGIPSPVGPDGQGGGFIGSVVFGNKWVIPQSSDKAKEAIQFLDRFFDDDVRHLVIWGIEGLDHEIVDGKVNYFYPEGDSEEASRETMHNHWLNFVGPHFSLDTEFMKGKPEGDRINDAILISRSEGRVNDGLDMPVPQTISTRPELAWDGMFIETAAKIITGKDPLDTFDRFVETWRSQGGDQAIAEATAWYNAK